MIYKLLVVDDDEDISKTLAHLYTSVISDYVVKVAQSVKDAEAIAIKFRPDVIVIDGSASREAVMNEDITRLASLSSYARVKPKTILILDARMIGRTLIEKEADYVFPKPFQFNVIHTITKEVYEKEPEKEDPVSVGAKKDQSAEVPDDFKSVLPSKRKIFEQFQKLSGKVDIMWSECQEEAERVKRAEWKIKKEERRKQERRKEI